jgi:hypothetical protein
VTSAQDRAKWAHTIKTVRACADELERPQWVEERGADRHAYHRRLAEQLRCLAACMETGQPKVPAAVMSGTRAASARNTIISLPVWNHATIVHETYQLDRDRVNSPAKEGVPGSYLRTAKWVAESVGSSACHPSRCAAWSAS